MTNRQKWTLVFLGWLVLIVWCYGISLLSSIMKEPDISDSKPTATLAPKPATTLTPRPTATSRKMFRIRPNLQCYHDHIGNMIIKGTIENIGGRDVRFVRLRGTVYDRNGKIVNTRWSYADSDILYKGASSTFTVYVDDPDDKGVECEIEVESYKETR